MRRRAFTALLALSLSALVGCGKGRTPELEKAKESPEMPTVEVSAAPDAAYSTADDRVERRPSANSVAGALPDGFPPDIPLYRPSSLIDFLPRPEGGYVVVFATPSSSATVSSALGQALRVAGWQSEGSGGWTKSGRKLRLVVQESAAGCRFRIEF